MRIENIAITLSFIRSTLGADLGVGRDGQLPISGPLAKPASVEQPNIVFILTDDQDLHMGSLDYMPLVQKQIASKGTSFKRHFCTTAICCPARVSLLTGQLAHNTNVTDIMPPYGGYPKFISQGYNDNYLPVWLQAAGYDTYYAGKLFNAHSLTNYDSPHVGGWTQSDFLLDPRTYHYLNASYQRNHDPPISYIGQHTIDVLASKAYGFLDDAAKGEKPFFLGIAPVAPHSNLEPDEGTELTNHTNLNSNHVTPPIPAERHKHLFKDVKIPRTEHFNPDQPSGANWIRDRKQLTDENVDFIDHYYRQRLRALQSVDELVDGVIKKLEEYDILDNTYIFYTTDNGFHVGQHRLNPGKECSLLEDTNIPLLVRGPGVPEGQVSEIITTHTDLAPTFLSLANAPLRASFDGEPIPLTKESLQSAERSRTEHITVEFWGIAVFESVYKFEEEVFLRNNTYKTVRVINENYNLRYTVWCTNEHELYDLTTDPYELHNLLHEDEQALAPSHLLGVPLAKVVDRLDSLLFVLKSCKGQVCIRPWEALHPQGNVETLKDALSPRFDQFYVQQKRVSYDHCEDGYVVAAEGPQFEQDGYVYRQGLPWSEWV